jgi:hypothetical protein
MASNYGAFATRGKMSALRRWCFSALVVVYPSPRRHSQYTAKRVKVQ